MTNIEATRPSRDQVASLVLRLRDQIVDEARRAQGMPRWLRSMYARIEAGAPKEGDFARDQDGHQVVWLNGMWRSYTDDRPVPPVGAEAERLLEEAGALIKDLSEALSEIRRALPIRLDDEAASLGQSMEALSLLVKSEAFLQKCGMPNAALFTRIDIGLRKPS